MVARVFMSSLLAALASFVSHQLVGRTYPCPRRRAYILIVESGARPHTRRHGHETTIRGPTKYKQTFVGGYCCVQRSISS